VRRRLGDRRARPRFDILGDLWGTLETVLHLPLRNIGRGGALLESATALVPESVHRLTMRAGGQDVSTQVRVRHVEAQRGMSGEPSYLIGVEFLSMHPVLLEQIEQWAAAERGELAAEA
jgi:hypothetical protein